MMLWVVMIVGIVGGSVWAASMPRAEMETFLKTATVLAVEDVGEGVTKPWKVTLARKGQQVPAIFKGIDLKMDAEARFGAEMADEYADSYRHELAAYELDKLLDLNVLPVAVERRINGRAGALRQWIDDIQPRYGHGQRPPDMAQMRDWMHFIWMFDYLISNMDRRIHNLLVNPNWTPILIDHSLAFATYQKPVRPLYRFPKEVIVRLKALKPKTIQVAMAPYLRPKQIDALLVRRKRILAMVADRVKAVGEDATFFMMADLVR